MHLPGNVGRYDEVPLPEFDNLEPRYIEPDSSRRLSAWAKARETERRLDHFEWLVHVARRPTGIQTFVADLASAYLLSFESALQVLQAEKFQTGCEKWLASLPSNDLIFRGLRTIRHLEAHIRPGALTQRAVGGHSRFTGGEGGSNIGWRWAPVDPAEFQRLKTPRISEAELSDWNRQVDEFLIMDLMRIGVDRLLTVFTEAERVP